MADFFDEFGKKVADVASDLSKKAGDTMEVQKLKSEIRFLKRGNQRDFEDIGKAVYEKFTKNEIQDMDMIALCEAIEKRDLENLCEELGDVLLQVLMHSQIAEETGEFTLEDVIDTVSRKMIRRHPHVFGDVVADTPEECLRLWEQVKAEEKAQKNKKRQGFTKISDSEV